MNIHSEPPPVGSDSNDKKIVVAANSRLVSLILVGIVLTALGTAIMTAAERTGILTATLGLLIMMAGCIQGTKRVLRHGRIKRPGSFFLWLFAAVFLIAALWGVGTSLFSFYRSLYLFNEGVRDRALTLCFFGVVKLMLGAACGLVAKSMLRALKKGSNLV